jgi:hypothetical protein
VGDLGGGIAGPALGLTGRSVHLAGDAIIVAADIGVAADPAPSRPRPGAGERAGSPG